MFRFFESLIDPYTPYAETDAPPTRLWPFLRDYLRPRAQGHGLDGARGTRGRGDRDLAHLVRGARRRRARRHPAGRGLGAARGGARPRRGLHPHRAAARPDRECGAHQPVADAQRRHHRALAEQPARAAPVGRLVPERLRRAHRQPDDADRPGGGRGDLPDLRRHGLCGGLSRGRALAAQRHRPQARPAAPRLARALPLARRLDGSAGRARRRRRSRTPARRSPGGSSTATPTSSR